MSTSATSASALAQLGTLEPTFGDGGKGRQVTSQCTNPANRPSNGILGISSEPCCR